MSKPKSSPKSGRRTAGKRTAGNPAKRGQPRIQPPESAFHSWSRRSLVWLSRLPPLAIPAVALVLILLGLAGPLWIGAPALTLAALFVLWLSVLSWPVLPPGGRVVRVLMLALIVGSLAMRIIGS